MVIPQGTPRSANHRQPGVAQACVVCYQKKIRCDLSPDKTTCSNCSLYNTECQPRLRKRKRAASSNRDSQDAPLRRSLPDRPTASEFQPAPIETGHPNSWDERSRSVYRTQRASRRYSVRTPTEHASQDDIPTPGQDDEGDAPPATPTSRVHDGRSFYFPSIEGRHVESNQAYPEASGLSPAEMATLQTSQAFELPPRALKACFIDNFFRHVAPFYPIVEPHWLEETGGQTPSMLLLQSVLLAGSRVTAPPDLGRSSDLYSRAKALFFSNHEHNPIMLIISCLLLQYWNPVGPERISMDSSSFWLRTGVGIALQIGLYRDSAHKKDAAYRKRLWWSLMARDCQVSAAHGRPRAVTPLDCTVSSPSLGDFAPQDPHALIFVNYVAINRIFGSIGESCRRGEMDETRLSQLRNDLYCWIKELPNELRLFRTPPRDGLNSYSFAARQIHVLYFAAITILFRPPRSAASSISAASLLASSFTAAIFDEFLVRNEMSALGPAIHKFFLLSAGITLITASRNADLRTQATEDLNVIKAALVKFSERYPSSLATLHTLEALESAPEKASGAVIPPLLLDSKVHGLFSEFGSGMCRQWNLLDASKRGPSTSDHRRYVGPATRQNLKTTVSGENDRDIEVNLPPVLNNDASMALVGFNTAVPTGADTLDVPWPSDWPEINDPMAWILDDSAFQYGA